MALQTETMGRAGLLEELDTALRVAAPEWRVSTLRQITELFLGSASSYAPEHVAIYDAVMARLIDSVGQAALAELSTRLARIANAPPDTVSRLSRHDSIDVARPILELSHAVPVSHIAEAAKTKGQDHLMAIASRASIDASISDILIDRGNSDVIDKVIDNEGASLSEIGYVKLISKAKHDKPLAKRIARRKDVPQELQSFLSLAIGQAEAAA